MLIRLLFCLFAEDVGILPPKLFTRLVTRPKQNAAAFRDQLRQLFAAMATGAGLALADLRGMRYLPVLHRASWVRDTSVNYIAEFARGDGPAPPAAAPVVDAAAEKEIPCGS